MGLTQVDSGLFAGLNYNRVVSVRPESALLTDDAQGIYNKCYSREWFSPQVTRLGVTLKPETEVRLLRTQSQGTSEFYRETRVIQVAETLLLEERFSPEFLGVDLKSKSILMRRLPYGTWESHFKEEKNGTKKKAEELIDGLVAFHGILGKHFKLFYQGVTTGFDESSSNLKSALRPRTRQEEYERMINYFRTIIFGGGSAEFSEYLRSEDRNKTIENAKTASAKRRAIRKFIANFSHEQGLNLEEAVGDFVDRNRTIFYGDYFDLVPQKGVTPTTVQQQAEVLEHSYHSGLVTIIHGDYNPCNIFRVPVVESDQSPVKVCDFPEMRVDHRHIDVATAVYNDFIVPKTPEQELNALTLVKRYVDGVKEREKVEYEPRQFMVETLETRLVQLVRLFAVDCILSNELLMSTPNFYGFDVREAVLDKMFREKFRKLSEGVFAGEVWNYIWDFPKAKELRKQVELVQEIFLKTGILPTTRSLDDAHS